MVVDAQSGQRVLLRQQRGAKAGLGEEHAGREDSEAAIAERRAAEYDWRQRRLRAAEEERSLRSEIERLCPNGTYTSYGRMACR